MQYDRRVNERTKPEQQKKDCTNPLNDEEPRLTVQTTAEINIFATGQQHTEQPEFINEGEVDQNAEQCHDICPLPAKLTDDKTTELSNKSLESENVCLKTTVASERHSPLAQQRYSLKYRYIVLSYRGRTQSLVAKKKDIAENRASRNFDLMITKRRLITADQASVFIGMMSVHISSGLVLHQMTSDHNRSELGIQDHSNEQSSSKLVPKVVP
ncbi:hypothetical protein Tco_0073219 [Tanacetum coccineum]